MFEKAKEKYEYYASPIPPDTTMGTLQNRWRASTKIEAIQSEIQPENVADDPIKKLTSSNAN